MMGTFGGALEARQIDASNGKLTADVTGEVEAEDGVLVIRQIHVAMRLVVTGEVKETVERVHRIYAMPSIPHPAQRHPAHFFLCTCAPGCWILIRMVRGRIMFTGDAESNTMKGISTT
jgi:hypothetical protein